MGPRAGRLLVIVSILAMTPFVAWQDERRPVRAHAATGQDAAHPPRAHGSGHSLRFFGNGVNDIDRVKIALDLPHRPVDVGVTDFTVEWWMKAISGENSAPACTPGGDGWIFGNVILDRDVYFNGDHGDWGVSLGNGRVAFGASRGGNGQTVCGVTNVADGVWRHLAVTRQASTGQMRIFVDGQVDASATGASGDISYRDRRPTSFPNDPFLVIGAEKHDAGSQYPSYSGWIDEIRVSNVIRYAAAFTRPADPFITDASTVALYHLDEGAGDVVGDSSGVVGGPSNGVRRFGGSPAGPLWSTDSPFSSVLQCLPRPQVSVHVAGGAPGRLDVTITAGTPPTAPDNRLRSLRFGTASNALIDVAGLVGQPGGFTTDFNPPTGQTSFSVRRAQPGAAVTVPLVVVDGCGDWPTFVGGGPAAF